MEFSLDNEYALVRDMCRRFAQQEVKPIAAELDEKERFPEETIPKLAKAGLLGIPFPKEYGGQGGDDLAYMICMEEIAKACLTTSVVLGAHTSLCAYPIYNWGTEEQKQKFLVPLAKGEKLGAFGLTEAGAGSDAALQQTKAVLEGDHYILNGNKIFITSAGYADLYIIMCMTDKSKGTRGISALIVEKGTPGFTFGAKEKKMGIKGSCTAELIFRDCPVPKENLLGAEGQGFKIAMHTLDGGRIGVGAQATGLAQGAIDETVKYTKERKQFGRRISQFQNTQFELASMQAAVEACRTLTYKAACEKRDGRPYGHLAAMVKLFGSEVANDVTRRCLQLFGGYGYTREYPIERMMRDAKILEIYEGTSEIQKMVIAGWMGVK
ncbi:MAG: acyl-CoA dehydrogenase [Oscillospiraceae bacterium]|jgi:butyryl-CoA dehydrogenase